MKKSFFLMLTIVLLSASVSAGTWNPEETLTAFLKDHYPWTKITLSDLTLSESAPQDSPVVITVEQSPPGRTSFTLEFADKKKIRAVGMVKAFDPVVMSRRSLNKGVALQKDDVYTVFLELNRISKGAVRNEESIIGRPLSRAISANVLITETMIVDAAVLKKGQKVQLIVHTPGLMVKAVGELQHNSVVGSYVKVVNLASKKVLTGLLTDTQTVNVGL
jgi:flagella basal body P-ring formation protein FlgA